MEKQPVAEATVLSSAEMSPQSSFQLLSLCDLEMESSDCPLCIH